MNAILYDIVGPWPGRLAILPRPRGNDWLEDDLRAWRSAGISVVVSALTPEEWTELGLEEEAELCRANGIEFVSFPITDRGVPSSAKEAAQLIHQLESRLAVGEGVGIHCRQGVGRSALLAVCLLIASGVPGEVAWERVATARSCPVPDTVEQREWVARFARNYPAMVSQD